MYDRTRWFNGTGRCAAAGSGMAPVETDDAGRKSIDADGISEVVALETTSPDAESDACACIGLDAPTVSAARSTKTSQRGELAQNMQGKD